MNYKEYLIKWSSGIQDELVFWNNFIANEGGQFFWGFEKTTSSNRRFELDEDIPAELYGKELKFIDVGAGPFSRCGKVTEKVRLNAISVDPLAYAYSELKKKYGVDNGIRLETGFVELLDKKFGANSFDIVHMSNSLDHCFSAIDGIYQLLNICKIGGKVILRHHENEAQNENYEGLHQWNLSLHNAEDSFIIWRDNDRFDVCKMFAQYADFELYRDIHEKGGSWVYNKVVMIKKKDITLPKNMYYEMLIDVFYQKLLDIYLKNTFKIYADKSPSEFDLRLKKVKALKHNIAKVDEVLQSLNIKSIALYGMGAMGRNLDYMLNASECKIVERIDIKGAGSGVPDAKPLNELQCLDVDAVIITINDDEVYKELKRRTNGKIYKIDEFLQLF